jgi:hypothetical protein
MRRREFVLASAGLAGALLDRDADAQGRPCPPPVLGAEGGTTGETPCLAVDANADWAARSDGAGVFFRHNFTYRNAGETVQIASDADLRASSHNGVTDGSARVVWDTTNKLSGNGSLRINQLRTPVGNYSGFRVGWDGIGATTKSTRKQTLYVQFAFLADAVYRNTYFGLTTDEGGPWGGKMAILQAPDRSNGIGEVVLRRCSKPGGYFLAYRLDDQGRYRHFYMQFNNVGGSSQWTSYPFIDRGAPAVTNLSTLHRRHGPTYSNDAQAQNSADYSHVPRFPANDWFVFEIYVNMAADTVKIWGAPYGQAPVLCTGGYGSYVRLPPPGTTDGLGIPLYSGIQFTNYPNDSSSAALWNATDTYICYDEVIASDNPIPFPGGHSLPYPGTQPVPNFPPSGASGY